MVFNSKQFLHGSNFYSKYINMLKMFFSFPHFSSVSWFWNVKRTLIALWLKESKTKNNHKPPNPNKSEIRAMWSKPGFSFPSVESKIFLKCFFLWIPTWKDVTGPVLNDVFHNQFYLSLHLTECYFVPQKMQTKLVD